jgi:hypothetical protein
MFNAKIGTQDLDATFGLGVWILMFAVSLIERRNTNEEL